jgi:hypothetical protein
MNNKSRKIVLLADSGVGLLIARAALAPVLTWLLNLGIRKIPGYRGRVQSVNIHFAAPSLIVRGLTLAKSNGTKTEQLLEIKSVIVGSHWRAILTGSLIGYQIRSAEPPMNDIHSGRGPVAPGFAPSPGRRRRPGLEIIRLKTDGYDRNGEHEADTELAMLRKAFLFHISLREAARRASAFDWLDSVQEADAELESPL